MAKPRHEHDCNRCKFIGTIDIFMGIRCKVEHCWPGEYDIYVCPINDDPDEKIIDTIVCRWSSEGSDYLSGSMSMCWGNLVQIHAKKMAIDAGYIDRW